MFVLRKEKDIAFICSAKTLEELKIKINKCFWNTKGLKPRGSAFNLSDYMKDKVVSKVTIENVSPINYT